MISNCCFQVELEILDKMVLGDEQDRQVTEERKEGVASQELLEIEDQMDNQVLQVSY